MLESTDNQHFETFDNCTLALSTTTANTFKVTLFFEESCQIVCVRSYYLLIQLKEMTDVVLHNPMPIIDDATTRQVIKEQGFKIYLKIDKSYDEMYRYFKNTPFICDFELLQLYKN
ncbi:hypothetical protein F9B85_02960 [Heliorestis acidaminivorans]|uniref:Chemotaxis protein CheA P2 response regulator-binding domain-containing protein n=1 Tax=Heliorestis acidaminivorans TaxID=553427 RepID=A0A6I0EXW3_9FIRM|nr:hypothetical protein [Heliorestis acidaminivorans]KAB2954649.1 hypothetical protein F9B85_02960 [Heliorestis acidaminivorans]